MTIDVGTRMAYIDGELDEIARRRVERAMADDPALAEAVTRDRGRTQMIARHVRKAGFAGIRALRRSDPSGVTHTIGIFGPSGPQTEIKGWLPEEGLSLVRPRPPVPPPLTMKLSDPA